jgi:RNA polymerase sigma-70 factor (ECF subfamily)
VSSSTEIRARAEDLRSVLADEGAFRAWYDRTLPAVYSFVLYRVGGREPLAMELTQEAFVEAIRSVDRFDGRSSSLTWICAIARHRIADHFRRQVRYERRISSLRSISPEREADPRDWQEASDARGDVLRALRGLPPAQASALALHYLDGLSVAEISRLLRRTEKAVESLLSRARESFRREYGGGADG